MSSGGFKYITVEDAKRTAEYINSLGEITKLNADAQEYSYQAQSLRANKAIYETENSLAQSLLQANTDFGISELQQKGVMQEGDTQRAIMSDISQQRTTEVKGAYAVKSSDLSSLNAVKSAELKSKFDVQGKELSLRGQASELAFNAISTTNDLREKLYMIRRGVEAAVGKVTASFAERGITSKNAAALISVDLNDRLYRTSIASDSAKALIQYDSDRLSLLDETNRLNYAEHDAITAQNYQQQAEMSALTHEEYGAVTGAQRQGLTQDIVNAQQNLGLQLQLNSIQADELITTNGIKSQQTYYDSVVKTYQDEVQARLYTHKSQVASQLAANQLQGIRLKYKASAENAKFVSLED